MGCIDQYQVCNPNITPSKADTGCTTLSGAYQLLKTIKYLGLSKRQEASLLRILYVLGEIDMYATVRGRGASALNAMETLYHLEQGHLPSNQWTIEVSLWFACTLARLQQAVVDYATGPGRVADGQFIYHPSTGDDKELCYLQKVAKAPGYQNFSMLGVCIIVVICILITVTSQSIEPVVRMIRRAGSWDWDMDRNTVLLESGNRDRAELELLERPPPEVNQDSPPNSPPVEQPPAQTA
jgi:hypothetical protein